MTDERRQLHGACHCGNIRFVLLTTKADAELPKRQCQCSFCRQHGRVSTSDPAGEIRVTVAAPERVNRYGFGHRTADFHVCMNCGGVPVVTSDVDGTVIGLVDIRMIDGFSWSRDETTTNDYDGEAPDDRQARRRLNWTPRVSFD
jgi:hypothetical protein